MGQCLARAAVEGPGRPCSPGTPPEDDLPGGGAAEGGQRVLKASGSRHD